MGDFDKTKPAGTTKLRLSDDQIRDNWDAIEDALVRMGMKFPTGYGTDAGELLVPIFQKQVADPDTPAADKLKLYVKTVGTQPRPYIKDPGGDVLPLAIPGENIFPSGTKMLFYQDTAPEGWTIQDTLDDKLVFVTKGSAAGGQIGGGVHSTGSWTISGLTQAAHTHTGPSHTHTGPSHVHMWYDAEGQGASDQSFNGGGGEMDLVAGMLKGNGFTAMITFAANGGVVTGPNQDLYTNAGDFGNTGAAGTGDTSSAQPAVSQGGAWRPASYACIIAEKD